MKKIFAFLALSFFLISGVNAQEEFVEFFPSATSTISYTPAVTVTSSIVDAVPGESSTSSISLGAEPKIRVGVYKSDRKMVFTSPFSYSIYLGDEYVGNLPENETASISYDKGVYKFESFSFFVTGTYKIRLEPMSYENYFTVVNLDRHLNTRSKMNFNSYRGVFEYWYSEKSKMPYFVNELYLEDYVKGVAETSNGAPAEYIKALQIAARTYALSNIKKAPPSIKNMFDVYASTVDQLYLGYNFESDNSQIVKFSKETSGVVVTYQGAPVPTYYFSRSNGKTKSSKTQPWLKSVVAKYDKGKSMYGHGYGMSNQDAAMRAKKDGWTSEQILTYYYSSVQVEKIY